MTQIATTNLDRLITPDGLDLNKIEWRGLRAFPAYEVSEYGHVRRHWRACGSVVGKLLSPKNHTFGYPRYDLYKNGKRYGREAHVLVAEEFLPFPQVEDVEIAHLDGRVNNCHYKNLAWKTHRENEADKVLHGTSSRGERNGSAKLTELRVRQIRDLYRMGLSISKLSADFGVTFQTVSKIINRQRWGHIE